MKALMEAEGLPYGERTHSYNSRLAQELAKWAEAKGKGSTFHDAIFRAYFVEDRNIGKMGEIKVLVRKEDQDLAKEVIRESGNDREV